MASVSRGKWKSQFQEQDGASCFHKHIQDVLKQRPFSLSNAYQEVAVADLVPGYRSTGHRFDWYLPNLNAVLELHGAQHYKATSFGKQSYVDKELNFVQMQARDSAKKYAALEQGLLYVEIPYTEYKKMTPEKLMKYIQEAMNDQED